MPQLGVPSDKVTELERQAIYIADAKNHHLSEWRRMFRIMLAEGYIDNELFADLMDSASYIDEALMIAKEQNALIQRHAKSIYGGDDCDE